MNDPLASAPTVAQHAKALGLLRGKHSHEAIAAATGLSLAQVAAIARIHQPKAKTWKGKRRC